MEKDCLIEGANRDILILMSLSRPESPNFLCKSGDCFQMCSVMKVFSKVKTCKGIQQIRCVCVYVDIVTQSFLFQLKTS